MPMECRPSVGGFKAWFRGRHPRGRGRIKDSDGSSEQLGFTQIAFRPLFFFSWR